MTHVDDLENLRKRAKELVRQHRRGMHTVAQRIRLALPRFDGMSDADVLTAEFKLHDAQELLAREHGFATWAELKEEPPVTTTDTTVEQRFERATTCLFTTDFARAIAFYCDRLGFDVAYTYGEPAFWGELVRDGAILNLRHVDESPWVAGVRDAEQLLSAYVLIADAKSLFLECQAKGVDFHTRLERKPWDMNEFIVRDPDGNLILFGSEQ